MVVSNHGYGISVADSEWSSNVWTGKILANDDDEPVAIELEAHPAAPVEIVVTRGALREPVVEAWIDVCRGHSFDWVDALGNVRGAGATFSSWIQTDARGMARAGLGRGEYELRLRSGAWEENRKFEVTGAEPLSVEFHRPWLAKRQMINGRFVLHGAPYKPSPNAVLKATARAEGQAPVAVDADLNQDGTFDIKDDTPSVSIYFVDSDRRLCGFARAGSDDDSVTIMLAPIPDAETPGLEYCASKAAEDAVMQADAASSIKIYDELIVLVPDLPSTFRRRGRVFAQMGKYTEAIADFRDALRLDARDPDAHNDLAWVLATCPVAEHRNADDAFRHANTACELTEGKNPAFLATLAAALAEQGDFSQAVKGQVKALSLAPENEKTAYARRVELYKARKAFRDEPTKINAPKN
jgi:tetratricopeptide (TPR) repeat protein